jgi:hypothetical protein
VDVDIDAPSFFVSLLVSSIGFVAFSYGKSQRRLPQMVAGLVLMVYPYFVDGLAMMIVIGLLIIGAMIAALRLGY